MAISGINSYNYVSPYSKVNTTPKAAETEAKTEKTSEKQEITKEYVSNLLSANQKNYNKSLISGFNSANKLGGISSVLSDMSSSFTTLEFMKSGAYSKLINKYYSQMNAKDTSAQALAVDNARKSAVELNSAANSISRTSLYKTDSADNRKKILDAAKQFVSAYNQSMTDVAEVDDVKMLQKGVSVVSMTAAVSGSLGRVGITIGEDNKLTIDEKKFSEASMGQLEAVFSGNNSYTNRIAQKAVMIANNASVSGYTANGSYNYTASTNGILNTMF
ncbi:MAG: hypothetical protein J6C75_04295 [Oscillospiraceae bacterium]|nr:hypothetical protein [Oscillospiraceae bacterium]